jgi:AI-2 transport protein TqsA
MESEPSQARIRTICLMILTAAVVIYGVYWLRPVLVPFVLSVFVVSAVTPLLKALESHLGVSRLVATAITFLVGMAVLFVVGLAIWFSFIEVIRNSAAYEQRVVELSKRAEQWMPDSWTTTSSSATAGSPENELSGDASKSRQILADTVRSGISLISSTLFSLISTGIIVLIYVFFLLLGSVDSIHPGAAWRSIDEQIRSYIALKTVISLGTGLVFGLVLRLFGVPMALTFGVMAFLLNFIPNVGPIVASLLPVPFIVLHPDATPLWMAAVLLSAGLVQLASGNVVEPKLMGESSDLHPVTVLFALMFWGMMWGIIGMFVATPVTAGIKIVLERFEPTRSVAGIMAGRWDTP